MISSPADLLGQKVLTSSQFENIYLKYKPFLYPTDINDLNSQVINIRKILRINWFFKEMIELLRNRDIDVVLDENLYLQYVGQYDCSFFVS